MCLAFPMKVVEVDGKTAKVEFQGEVKTVDSSIISGLKKDDYVLAHGDMAIQKLDRKDAEETLKVLNEICECHTH